MNPPRPGSKTSVALHELNQILHLGVVDGHVSDAEIRQLLQWKATHKNVLRQPALTPFMTWLNAALADGEIDARERGELMIWAQAVAAMDHEPEHREVSEVKVIRPPIALPHGWTMVDDTDWGKQEATAKQVGFLVHLGVSRSRAERLSKREASDLIDEMLDRQRRAKGCGMAVLVLMLGILVFLAAEHRNT
jgi:hypothetical protein